MTDLLTLAQVAAWTGLSRFTLARACLTGRLAAIKPGHDYLTTKAAVEAAIAAGTLRPRPRREETR